jgi:hypothetical protein
MRGIAVAPNERVRGGAVPWRPAGAQVQLSDQCRVGHPHCHIAMRPATQAERWRQVGVVWSCDLSLPSLTSNASGKSTISPTSQSRDVTFAVIAGVTFSVLWIRTKLRYILRIG